MLISGGIQKPAFSDRTRSCRTRSVNLGRVINYSITLDPRLRQKHCEFWEYNSDRKRISRRH